MFCLHNSLQCLYLSILNNNWLIDRTIDYCILRVKGLSERCGGFEINATTGLITTTSGLSHADYPSSGGASCILTIIASDSGQPRRQTVHHLTINTAVQPSSCSRPSERNSFNISFTIEENTLPGSIVGYLSSSEYFKDINSSSDVNNGETSFWLAAGNALDTFSVDSQTGALIIAGPVDFESCSCYRLVVWIFDGLGKCVGVLNVEVSVVNVNDNPPQFDVDLIYIEVREATPLGAEIYAPLAYDADGSDLFYALREEGAAYWLRLDNVTGHVVTRRLLEGAPRRMHVTLTASDVRYEVSDDVRSGHVASMTLVLTVAKDAESTCGPHSARMIQRRVTAMENAEIESIIDAGDDVTVTSSCRNSTLLYSVISSNDYDKFVVDLFTG